MKKYIGCDLGGTNLRTAIVDVESGDVIHQMSIPTLARDGPDALMKRMAGLFLPFTIYLQSVLGLTALQAGLVYVPFSLMSMFASPVGAIARS